MLEAFLYTLIGGLFGFTIGMRIGYIVFGRWGEKMDEEENGQETA